jgi:hypothetical protein
MSWQKVQSDPQVWKFIVDDRVIAEVSFQQGNAWQWFRFTTVSQDGVPGARGCEESRAMAQREAMRGVALPAK